jgi:hypothetical protein
MLLYKPQFVLGFLLLWVIWRQFKALIAFSVISLLWVGSFILLHGLESTENYLATSQSLILLPYLEGFPGYLLITVYGFLATLHSLLPDQWFQPTSLHATQQAIYTFSQGLFLVMGVALAWLAFRLRYQSIQARTPALLLALLWPLVTTPYALLHDMLILIPAFVLWARYAPSRGLLYTVILVYLGAFFLTLVAALTKVALMALLTFWVTGLLIYWVAANWTSLSGRFKAGQAEN